MGVRAHVALRVNLSGEAEGGGMRMEGRPAVFGIDEESLDEVLDRLVSFNGLTFRGVHLFTGTQILDFRILVSQYQKGVKIARRVTVHLKRSCNAGLRWRARHSVLFRMNRQWTL
jgi:diaminopimelate decarboxylase